jgi:GLPGLI family protein
MKKIICTLLICLCFWTQTQAQITEGFAIYEIPRQGLSEEEADQHIAAMQKKMHLYEEQIIALKKQYMEPPSTIYELTFNAHETLGFQKVEGILPQSFLYRNYTTKEVLKQAYLFEKPFVITDYEIPKITWKTTDSTKTIQAFKAKYATAVLTDSTEIGAWFTEDVPVSVGPYSCIGLPGLILEVHAPKHSIYLMTFSTQIPKKNKIKKPNKGKRITYSEYQEIQKKQTIQLEDGSSIIFNN